MDGSEKVEFTLGKRYIPFPPDPSVSFLFSVLISSRISHLFSASCYSIHAVLTVWSWEGAGG